MDQAPEQPCAETPPPPLLDRLPRRAVWIASYPKSGSTWVRVFLHNLLRELRGQHDTAQDINALNQMVIRESVQEGFSRRLGKPAREASAKEIAQIRTQVQADLVQGEGGPVFIKTHSAAAFVEGFPTFNFDVTLAAIYIVRNPLDVAVSYAHHNGVPVDAVIPSMADPAAIIAGDEWRVQEYMGSWSFHASSWTSIVARPVLVMRYEDMLEAPEFSFGRLASFLRLNASEEQLQRAIGKSSFSELSKQEEAKGFVERPQSAKKFFREGKAGQWQEVLTEAQVSAIVAAHAPMMMRFGYAPEDCCIV